MMLFFQDLQINDARRERTDGTVRFELPVTLSIDFVEESSLTQSSDTLPADVSLDVTNSPRRSGPFAPRGI